MRKGPWQLYHVSDHFKTQKMCEKAVKKYLCLLKYVRDWFVTQKQLKIWYDDCSNDKLTEWHNDYQKRKAQKAQIKEELIPVPWHRSRWWDWCVPNDEKKESEKL